MSAATRYMSSVTKIDIISEIAKAVSEIAGIQLGTRQRVMVETRLKKRMAKLEIATLEDYWEYFQLHRKDEITPLISLLTTHHTFFFREYAHFEFLEAAIPLMIPKIRQRTDKTLRVWSAACSGGQEVYSLSMFLNKLLSQIAPDVKYRIVGTDVDAESVARGRNGVYQHKEIQEIPMAMLGNHWQRGTGDISNFVKAKPSIKEPCYFFELNLLTFNASDVKEVFDVIFCRNVFIYFNVAQIKAITAKLINQLAPDGFIFTGVSESLSGLDLPLEQRGPSIYTRPPKDKTSSTASKTSIAKTDFKATASAEPLRVLCVDDSASIVTLLKQVLTEAHGFKIVGSAANGVEAKKFLAENKVDVMTLDIHMPIETGVEYLERNFNSHHIPVIMISSVSRENVDLALKALQLGASDYVEKPSFSNLKECGEEIRTKLRCAFRNKRGAASSLNLDVDRSFGQTFLIANTSNKLRVITANLSDIQRLHGILSEFKGDQPATVILVDGSNQALADLAKVFLDKVRHPIAHVQTIDKKLDDNKIYFTELAGAVDKLKIQYAAMNVSICVMGELTPASTAKISNWVGAQILLEDLGAGIHSPELRSAAVDQVPATSFAYMSCEYLSKAK